MTSASLMQARLPDLRQALAYAVSTPGVTTALVGMGKVEHVEANLI
jgi:aryl-alcohol dehydrogenase-like predicted oxidoreductase